MSETVRTEKRAFQAEVKQLLHLVTHSLYSNREIFLRELISNAADAADKLNFLALKDDGLYEGDSELQVTIEADKKARTLTIRDNGIGMTRDEVIENLGTIARSGTLEFLKNLDGSQRKDSRLIGQFGVGFYSAFIVADRVEVYTRKAGTPASEGVYWASEGTGEFDLGTRERPRRGTEIVLHLKPDQEEFLEPLRLKTLVHKYSDHIAIPVMLQGESEAEQINTATALWTRNPPEISDEEYQDFYRHISHDFGEALSWSHNRVEGNLDYTSLLYLPARAWSGLWRSDARHGLKLYVQRVFIMDDAEQFLPLYLRFVKGVIDSNDLSLNISREILQSDHTVASLRKALTRRVLTMLEKLAADEPEKYQQFWDNFGPVLKEGIAEDPSSHDTLLKLLRFASTHSGEATQNVSLADYKARMKTGQKHIYYLVADNHQAAIGSPHLEIFRDKGIEVLLLSDPVDAWTHPAEYEGIDLKDIARGELDPAELGDDTRKAEKPDETEFAALTTRIAEVLRDEVAGVRTTTRLTDSPACLVVGEHDMGLQLRRIYQAAGQPIPEGARARETLEINPQHPLLQRLEQESNDERARELIAVIHDQARLAGGEELRDPPAYVRRINKLLLELPGGPAPATGKPAAKKTTRPRKTTASRKTTAKKPGGSSKSAK